MDALDAQIAQKRAEEAARKAAEKAKQNGGEVEPATPVFPVKVRTTKNIPIKQMTGTASWRIETVDDVDKYLEALRTKLVANLTEGSDDLIISVVF